jgi:hypothetical protein
MGHENSLIEFFGKDDGGLENYLDKCSKLHLIICLLFKKP